MPQKNLPKFLLANNKNVNGEIYVVHTQEPRFIAKYTPENTLSHFEIVMEIDSFGIDVMKIASLMRRLGDWFVSQK